MPLPEHQSMVWDRIWGLGVEAAVLEMPGINLLPSLGLNYLFVHLPDKKKQVFHLTVATSRENHHFPLPTEFLELLAFLNLSPLLAPGMGLQDVTSCSSPFHEL